jgi:hypothetical protein
MTTPVKMLCEGAEYTCYRRLQTVSVDISIDLEFGGSSGTVRDDITVTNLIDKLF